MSPPTDLSPFIARLSYIEVSRTFIRHRVPDGCYKLLVLIGEQDARTRSYLIPPSLEWQLAEIPGHTTILEARFRWGAGKAFFGVTPDEFRSRMLEDYLVEGVSAVGRDWGYAVEQIGASAGKHARIELFTAALRQLAPPVSVIRPEVRMAAAMLERLRGDEGLDEVVNRSCLSASQLRRVFAKDLGISPKGMMRLSRLWTAMRCAVDEPGRPWWSIAAECRMADTAHLVDEFKRFSGVTPNKWLSYLSGLPTTE
ncbi:MAG: AraC family transcriptional regulator [Armatimonadetes bacterium]|nr:AraC family transcriptional regulator [Armatimonadota bacterium]